MELVVYASSEREKTVSTYIHTYILTCVDQDQPPAKKREKEREKSGRGKFLMNILSAGL